MSTTDIPSLVVGGTTLAEEYNGLPRNSKILIITTSSVAGVILICFLIYVIHRMRQGAALVDILKRRRDVPPPIAYQDYPIRFEQRYSVRSSRYTFSMLRRKNLPTLPGPVTQAGVPMTSTKPPSMVMEPHLAYLKGSDKKLPNLSSSKNNRISNVPTVSVRSMGPESTSPSSSTNPNTRWSWTNSEAPSTPRLNFERKRTSSGSLAPNYKPVGYNEHRMDAIDENSVALPSDKAQELLEIGGAGYLPPRQSKPKPAGWKDVFRKNSLNKS